MIQALLVFHTFFIIFTFGLLFLLNRIKTVRPVPRSILLGGFQLVMILLISLGNVLDGFARIQLLAWGVFLYFPLYLLGSVILLAKSKPVYAVFLSSIFILIIIVTIDAFLIEPRRLEVNQIQISAPKLTESIKIVLIADLQTDNPGDYERQVLDLAAAESPDLILLAGDYLQLSEKAAYQAGIKQLNRILVESGFDPRLGTFAVRGNVEWNQWEEIFQGMDVYTFDDSETLVFDEFALTGLSLSDSGNTNFEVTGTDPYHIVLGHSPNFSLGDIQGDLLLAGHTHGGQFQLPWIGPIITLTAVPNDWASGLTEIQPGQYLLVSRGIGMERGYAPRLRFLCRPELIIINLEPSEGNEK
jgi:predicted MPP superfamily phosphohydrolase